MDAKLGLLPPVVGARRGGHGRGAAVVPRRAARLGVGLRIGQQKVRRLRSPRWTGLIEVDLLRQGVTIYRHIDGDAATEDGLGYRQQTIIEIPALVHMGEPLGAQLDRFVDLIEGKVDAAAERRSIMPAHRVVGGGRPPRPRRLSAAARYRRTRGAGHRMVPRPRRPVLG